MIPYIGITDFTSFAEVEKMLKVFKSNKPADLYLQMHVGVMMSYKTLHDIDCEWTGVFPQKEDLAEIFSSKEVYNCLHYADYKGRPGLGEDLARVFSFAGPNLHALQLDMTWPDPRELAQAYFLSKRYDIEVILQLGTAALAACGNDPHRLCRRLENYQGGINRVLLDRSMGNGIPMKADELYPLIQKLVRDCPELFVTVAGGLGPKSFHLVKDLLEEFPNLSIDAQAQLRPSANIKDPIHWEMAEEYLIKAIKLYNRYH